jgi:hypothetical protein
MMDPTAGDERTTPVASDRLERIFDGLGAVMSSRPEKEEKLRNDAINTPFEISQEGGLKRYEAPRVESYAKLHEVTQFGGSIPTDSGGGPYGVPA